MFRLLVVSLALCPLAVLGEGVVLDVGDPVPNLCWKNETDRDVCLDDMPDRIRILIHTAAWSKACVEEMERLLPRLKEVESDPVSFLNLSSGGEGKGDLPDSAFLTRWREKLGLVFGGAFHVLASPRDPGRRFFGRQSEVPSVVVIDRERRIAHKQQGSNVEDVVRIARKMLTSRNAKLQTEAKFNELAAFDAVMGPAR